MMMGLGSLGALMMLLLWGAVIALAVWAISALFPGGGRHYVAASPGSLTARQIIDLRYGRGELTRDQYELMKQDLL
jgi:putative membrane protein